ncbi:hypothetical protein [Halovenus sp. HT40]|uniref:hypothetical protein n=1 Tax=Halovenus sp. HT40 TaxID=3126691 RepID=UPI00300EB5FC
MGELDETHFSDIGGAHLDITLYDGEWTIIPMDDADHDETYTVEAEIADDSEQWVAVINGPDDTYQYDREFIVHNNDDVTRRDYESKGRAYVSDGDIIEVVQKIGGERTDQFFRINGFDLDHIQQPSFDSESPHPTLG